MDDFTAWGCQRGAELTKGSGHSLRRFLGAANLDSQIAVMEASAPLKFDYERSVKIVDSIAVGYLNNDDNDLIYGRNGTQAGAMGIETPWKSSTFHVNGMAIHQMGEGVGVNPCYNSYPFDCVNTQWFQNFFWGEDVASKTQFDWEHEVQFYDMDGSYSETGVPSIVLRNTDIVPKTNGACVIDHAHSHRADQPGMVCDASQVWMVRTCFNEPDPESLLGFPFLVENFYGSSFIPWRVKRSTHGFGWCGFTGGFLEI